MSIKTDRVNAILETLGKTHGSTFSSLTVPSLNEVLRFKPITVGKQKSVSKLLIENTDKSTQFDVYNNLLTDLCLDRDKFDINTLTLIDRYKLLFDIFVANNYDSGIEVKCDNTECGKNIPVNIPYAAFSAKLATIPLNDVNHTYTNAETGITYSFTFGYPKVSRLSELYKSDKTTVTDTNSLMLSSMDYLKLYIKTMTLTTGNTEVLNVNFEDMTVAEMLEIISNIPQALFNKFELLEKIDAELISKLTNITHAITCPHCKTQQSDVINVHTFFLIS